jgi:hypothetical protein
VSAVLEWISGGIVAAGIIALCRWEMSHQEESWEFLAGPEENE